MLKQMKYHEEARKSLADGVNLLCKLVEDTYGPKGRNVLISRPDGSLMVTKSPAAIVQDLKEQDLFMDEGVQLAREAIMNTAKLAGDGSTLTAILIRSMMKEAEILLTAGVNPVFLRKGIRKACDLVCETLYKKSREIKSVQEFQQVLCTTCSSHFIAELVGEAFEKVTKDGIILVKESKYDAESYLEIVDGFMINQGPVSTGFIGDEEQELVMKHPYMLITNCEISKFSQILPLLESVVDKKVPLVIVGDHIQGEALQMLRHNHSKNVVQTVVVTMDGIGKRKEDAMEDLAILTGTRLISKERGDELETLVLQDLGRAKEVKVTREKTLIIGGKGKKESITDRIGEIERRMSSPAMEEYDKECHRERIGKLSDRVAIIHVGVVVQAERLEVKRRVESAIRAGRSALTQGVIIGGGSALIHAATCLKPFLVGFDEEDKGVKILYHALYAPLKVLCKNAGIEGSHALDEVSKSNQEEGFDVLRKKIVNMESKGILDPVFVLCTALEQSVSMIYEWVSTAAIMVSTAPDREDRELMKEGVPVMR